MTEPARAQEPGEVDAEEAAELPVALDMRVDPDRVGCPRELTAPN
jgi:hypothetical protein